MRLATNRMILRGKARSATDQYSANATGKNSKN
jgi:hypothetical protein